jgi:hypothetical protein
MIGDSYTFQAELWRWESRADEWVFAALPEDVSMEIGDQPRPPSGFGSVRVKVRIGLDLDDLDLPGCRPQRVRPARQEGRANGARNRGRRHGRDRDRTRRLADAPILVR